MTRKPREEKKEHERSEETKSYKETYGDHPFSENEFRRKVVKLGGKKKLN